MKKQLLFKTEPWEHQLKALKYLVKRDFGALYTDMGTGKTKVMLDLIQNRNFNSVLIVCPNTIVVNKVWDKQIDIHSYIPPKNVLNLGSLSSESKILKLKNFMKSDCKGTRVIICNYESVWRKPFCEHLMKAKIECVICDESHRIKSPSSKVSWFLTRLGKITPYRYLMTGTPLAENPCDIYAQYRFLAPEIFGTNYANFCNRYQNIDPIKTARVGFPVLDSKNPYKNLEELREKMFSCAFYIESSIKLPDCTDTEEEYQMSSKCAKIYKQVDKEGAIEFENGALEVNNVLSLIIRKQQICCGYVPYETDEGDTKFKKLDDSRLECLKYILECISLDEPIVIFCRFKREIKNVRKMCKEMGWSSSELSGRKNTFLEWQDGKTRILVAQYQLGSEGLDMTRARYCIYYSLTNALALYEQSRKRVHRPGQIKPVTYVHIISKLPKGNTIDTDLYVNLKAKKDIVQEIIKNRK